MVTTQWRAVALKSEFDTEVCETIIYKGGSFAEGSRLVFMDEAIIFNSVTSTHMLSTNSCVTFPAEL